MRYRLMPYLYSAFADANESGAPVARPLFFEFPGDSYARAVHLQWLLGADLLVSPVLHQVCLITHLYACYAPLSRITVKTY
jgi:alpha-glucosidase (family GH31 glycosyl hydrolase)